MSCEREIQFKATKPEQRKDCSDSQMIRLEGRDYSGRDYWMENMAEREGFEPSIRDKPYTPLAGERLQPLGHLSVALIIDLSNTNFTVVV